MRNDANNSSQSFVSIIIPCRNERKYIGPCLDCVLAQDYPREAMEVLVVDGVSSDGTREVLERYSAKHTFIRILDNPQKITPCALNIGIKRSRGDIIIRLDAHAYYPPEYVSRCVKHLNEFKVDNVGGVWITLPGADTIQAKAIAIVLASNFGVGNSLFRIGGLTEPTLVDTVPFGCFKRKVFDEIGLFDEDLIRNQDDEFNARLIKHGGKVLLIPEIWSEYYARATLAQLWRMYYQYGYFKPLASIKLGKVTTWRQLVPAFFIVSLIAL
ncbi:MAG: glycosyltransferase family 2 protein, partial [Candidatus Omnitrophota bacterium]